jgi:hypothetical protein
MCSGIVECCLVDASLCYAQPNPLYTPYDREEISYLVFRIILISRSIHVHGAKQAEYVEPRWACIIQRHKHRTCILFDVIIGQRENLIEALKRRLLSSMRVRGMD